MGWIPPSRPPVQEMGISISMASGWVPEMEQYVFRGHDEIPKDLAIKRIEYWQKKHPEDFGPLEEMMKKAYPKGLGVLIKDEVEVVKMKTSEFLDWLAIGAGIITRG